VTINTLKGAGTRTEEVTMPTNNVPRQTQQPPQGPTGNGPFLLIAALVATFLAATYVAPRFPHDPVINPGTSAQETLADAEAAAKAGNPKEARSILRALALKNNPEAQLRLAEMYEVGPTDGTPDLKQAAKWYAKAAASGIVEAKARLGHLYLEGIGVLQDFAKAKPLLEAAANDGNTKAQFDLGRMWQHGWGGEKDQRLGYAWFEFAAQQGCAPAIKARDALAASLSPEKVREAQDLVRKLKSNILQSPVKG
jgi:TPR repeat protein